MFRRVRERQERKRRAKLQAQRVAIREAFAPILALAKENGLCVAEVEVESGARFICSLRAGHDGNHIAEGYEGIVHMWGDT